MKIKNVNATMNVGTCRSYDEKRHVPSFIRELGTKETNEPMNNKIKINKLSTIATNDTNKSIAGGSP